MKKNQKVKVSATHPHWPGREGYFQFFASYGDAAVISADPVVPENRRQTLFSVKKTDLQAMEA